MMLVIHDFEIAVIVVEQRIGLPDADLRIRVRRTAQLFQHLVDVVVVDVAVAAGPNEFAGLESRLLGHHEGEQRIGGDVERHAEEHVAGTLVQLAAQAAVGHVELE